jgi:hypothetical protein
MLRISGARDMEGSGKILEGTLSQKNINRCFKNDFSSIYADGVNNV